MWGGGEGAGGGGVCTCVRAAVPKTTASSPTGDRNTIASDIARTLTFPITPASLGEKNTHLETVCFAR